MSFLARLEPRSRSADPTAGLAARLADPLWFLARQWQLGELVGDDAGTPVEVVHRAQVRPVTGWAVSGGSPHGYDPAAGPLEAAVEAQPSVWTARLRVDTGRELVRRMHEHGAGDDVAALVGLFPVDPAGPVTAGDPGGTRLRLLAGGRTPDGGKAHLALAAGLRATPPVLAVDDPAALADPQAVLAAAVEWLAWCDAIVGPAGPGPADGPGGPGTWRDDRHEYAFSVFAPAPSDGVRLDADEHAGHELDWYSFDAVPVAADPGAVVPERIARTLPTPATFRGMPDPRWWTFEDGTLDLGRIDANPADLARLAMLEFSLVFGNDFFVVPVRLPVGSLCRTTSLLVSDAFGLTTRVRPAPAGTSGQGRPPHGSEQWTMFTLSTSAGGAVSDLFLPPVAPQHLVSEPLEDVLMLRDEMANLAWAVEQRYEGDAGTAVDRAEQTRTPPTPTGEVAAAQAPTLLRYVLGTTTPEHWYPMEPVANAPWPQLSVTLMAHGAMEPPRGRLLHVGDRVEDEEVPREGKRLWRQRVLARWSSGSTVTWTRNRAGVGRGAGTSGLRFDMAEVSVSPPA